MVTRSTDGERKDVEQKADLVIRAGPVTDSGGAPFMADVARSTAQSLDCLLANLAERHALLRAN